MRISPLHRTVAAVVVGTVALSAVVAFAREDDRPSAAPPPSAATAAAPTPGPSRDVRPPASESATEATPAPAGPSGGQGGAPRLSGYKKLTERPACLPWR